MPRSDTIPDSWCLDTFREAIRALPDDPRLDRADLVNPTFRPHKQRSLEIYYCPFDSINTSAKIILVGVTPGWTQMEMAFRTARQVLATGLPDAEVLDRAKKAAAFAGTMRRNLVTMLDGIGVPEALSIETTDSMFGPDSSLVHSTSAIRYPVFVKGRNYAGHTPKIADTPILRRFVLGPFVEEIATIPKAIVVPLGKAVEGALNLVMDRGWLTRERCLFGFPHPSGANGHRAQQYTREKPALRRAVETWFARLEKEALEDVVIDELDELTTRLHHLPARIVERHLRGVEEGIGYLMDAIYRETNEQRKMRMVAVEYKLRLHLNRLDVQQQN